MTDSSNMTMSSDLPGVRFETIVPGEIDSAFEEDLQRFDAGDRTAHHASKSSDNCADNPLLQSDPLGNFKADSHDRF